MPLPCSSSVRPATSSEKSLSLYVLMYTVKRDLRWGLLSEPGKSSEKSVSWYVFMYTVTIPSTFFKFFFFKRRAPPCQASVKRDLLHVSEETYYRSKRDLLHADFSEGARLHDRARPRLCLRLRLRLWLCLRLCLRLWRDWFRVSSSSSSSTFFQQP